MRGGAGLRALAETERAALAILDEVAAGATSPEARACLEELRAAAVRLRAALAADAPPPGGRRRSGPGFPAGVTPEQVRTAPRDVDRLRLATRTQRWVLEEVERLLGGSLDPERRARLEGACALAARTVARCDGTIAALDREREVGPAPEPPGEGGP
jgi:hypothetical protein